MRKLLVVTAVASLAFTSNANAWGNGPGWNYGYGGGNYFTGNSSGSYNAGLASGAIVLGVGVISAIAGAIAGPRPQPMPAGVGGPPRPVYAPNTVPGCRQVALRDQYGQVMMTTQCP